jgi:pimeloyl-ACP methyl ester carboxylesterase
VRQPDIDPREEEIMAMSAKAENRVRRWREQRWLLDTAVAEQGVEFDQARINYTAGPAGLEAMGEFRMTAARCKKINDIAREYAIQAERREAKARAFDEQGRTIAARESYMIAAMLWSIARWPIFEMNDELEHLEKKMNECYANYMRYAAHPIERIEIPFGKGQSLPAYLHLPRKPAAGEKFPCVIAIGGMDGTKENSCAMYGDKLLERGIAIFAVDGPGQGECFARRVNVTYTAHMEAAEAHLKYLATNPAIDMNKLVLRGSSMGTFFSTQAASVLGKRIVALSQSAVCHEPGFDTIFNHAPPSFKMRFMYMAGFEDEAAFDEWVKQLDLRPLAKDIQVPYQVIAGEDDQLSPLQCTRELLSLVKTPRQFVVYEGAVHGVYNSPSTVVGENPQTLQADWIADRIAGKPIARSEEIFIANTGRATVKPLA